MLLGVSTTLAILEYKLIFYSINIKDHLLVIGSFMVVVSLINVLWTYLSTLFISTYVMNYIENALSDLQQASTYKDLSSLSATLVKKYTDGANRAVDGFLIPISLLPTRLVLVIAIFVSTHSSVEVNNSVLYVAFFIVVGLLVTFTTAIKISKFIGNRIHLSISARVKALEENTLGYKSYFYSGISHSIKQNFKTSLSNYKKNRPWSELMIHLPKLSLDIWLGLSLILVAYLDASASLALSASTIVVVIRLLPNLQIIMSILNQCASNYDAVQHFFTYNPPLNTNLSVPDAACRLTRDGLQFTKGSFTLFFKDRMNRLNGESGTGKSTLLYWIYNELYRGPEKVCLISSDPYLGSGEKIHIPDRFIPLYSLIADNGRLESLISNNFVCLTDITSLSLGERQRLSFVRAAVQSFDVYLLDECFSGVELELEEKILSWINNHSRLVIYVTHRTPKTQLSSYNIDSIKKGLKLL